MASTANGKFPNFSLTLSSNSYIANEFFIGFLRLLYTFNGGTVNRRRATSAKDSSVDAKTYGMIV